MTERPPVTDWTTDFDHLSGDWAAHSPEILADTTVDPCSTQDTVSATEAWGKPS